MYSELQSAPCTFPISGIVSSIYVLAIPFLDSGLPEHSGNIKLPLNEKLQCYHHYNLQPHLKCSRLLSFFFLFFPTSVVRQLSCSFHFILICSSFYSFCCPQNCLKPRQIIDTVANSMAMHS